MGSGCRRWWWERRGSVEGRIRVGEGGGEKEEEEGVDSSVES